MELNYLFVSLTQKFHASALQSMPVEKERSKLRTLLQKKEAEGATMIFASEVPS